MTIVCPFLLSFIILLTVVYTKVGIVTILVKDRNFEKILIHFLLFPLCSLQRKMLSLYPKIKVHNFCYLSLPWKCYGAGYVIISLTRFTIWLAP